jgi:glutamate-5-semialdehyde dehydrogenase
MNDITNQLSLVKNASHGLAFLAEDDRNTILLDLAARLREAVKGIMAENEKDLAVMDQQDPKYDRLLLSESRIFAMADDLETVATLSHPRSVVLEEKILPNGLRIQKVSVPLGVVAVIYESRPNVTVDVFSLCFKSGNACVLKGGKEAYHSNRYLVSLIQSSLEKHGIDKNILYLLPPERKAMDTLLQARDFVDVCIPRGSQSLIDVVRDKAKIPVIETGAGIVHTYFDVSGDLEKGRVIVDNAKTRRVSVCNALDTLIVHEARLADLPALVALLAGKQVALFADGLSYKALQASYPNTLLHKACPADFGQEFLDYKLSIKTVKSVEEAVNHIMRYSSGHSEAIIAEDQRTITYFLDQVDAAAVYVNASTAFTDGGQFGMGAEIGISTQKLHARGPMALDALTSYKWIVWGTGQIRV